MAYVHVEKQKHLITFYIVYGIRVMFASQKLLPLCVCTTITRLEMLQKFFVISLCVFSRNCS